MSSEDPQPFINNGAYYKATNSYVPFPSQSDAMLASLQLFHEVPCRIMNLIISTVTHPDFDTKQVTLKSSIDVIKVTEEARLQDRMAVVHRRSLNADGYMEQTTIPHFALYEVLDIVHAERMERIKTIFEETLDDDDASQFNERIPEADVLSNMSLVHRSWTFPAQQTLGRVVWIRKTVREMDFLSLTRHRAIYGPWTTAVALGFTTDHTYLRADSDVDLELIEFGLLQKFEILHRMLLSSPKLQRIYIRSYIPILTTWFNFTIREMVRHNAYLEELMLQSTHWSLTAQFDLDPLFENGNVSDNLRFLSIRRASFSNEVRDLLSKRSSFVRLRNLSFGITMDSADSRTLLTLLSVLSARSDPHLSSFSIFGCYYPTFSVIEKDLSPKQCTSLFEHLTTLHIVSDEVPHWFRWISPYCSRLEKVAFTTALFRDISDMRSLVLPTTIQSLELRIHKAHGPRDLKSITSCAGELLKIARSPFHSALKLITLSVPSVKPLNYAPEIKSTIGPYEAMIRELRADMSVTCGDTGIKFDFSWSEQCTL